MNLLIPSHGVQVMEHYKEFVETHEQGDLAAVATASEQWAADFDLEAVPDIPQADLPPQLPKVKSVWVYSARLVGPLSAWQQPCRMQLTMPCQTNCFAMVKLEYRRALMPGITLQVL